MRRLFITFYLLLMSCFVCATLLVGGVYQMTAERAGDRYLERMMQGSLGILTHSLANTARSQWPVQLQEFQQQFTLAMHIGPLSEQPLSDEDRAFLSAGNIVIVDEQDTFLQRIANSDQVLIVGPVPYLSYLHELQWLDLGLLLFIGLTLAFPILLWLRPHWRGLEKLEMAAKKLGEGNLAWRTELASHQSLARVGVTFDHMASQLQTMIAQRKQLTDAIAHELRTPLVRLRYRLALLEPMPTSSQALEQDLNALESLINEMLLYAKLDRPTLTLTISNIELTQWAQGQLANWQALSPEKCLQLQVTTQPLHWQGDPHLLARALENLLTNALRHAAHYVTLTISQQQQWYIFSVEDDGAGVDTSYAAHIFEPFFRLDPSRQRTTGGTGLGLTIVRSIAHHHGGEVCLQPTERGAQFILRLPVHLDTNRHAVHTEADIGSL